VSRAIVTGSAGLVGSEVARALAGRGMDVIGVDNDTRQWLFGQEASTLQSRSRLIAELGSSYTHLDADIRDQATIDRLFREHSDITAVVHTAAQPSHDWAARDPHTDFAINAVGTMNLLEATRAHAPDAAFIFTSTNKVYGDTPNHLPLEELEKRWEIAPSHSYVGGIPESMSIDNTMHSLFGVSKAAADLMVQEYGRYFGLRTACFRGGCLTGPGHAGTQLHGFLSYLVKCAATEQPYTVFGYKAKQVRDNIHSADLVDAFLAFLDAPRIGAVYNIGGGRFSNCSMLEAIEISQNVTGREMRWTYDETARMGDHMWWVSDLSAFQADYPEWKLRYDVPAIINEIYERNAEDWQK
jgi:CDP-paratose 2-epimerase